MIFFNSKYVEGKVLRAERSSAYDVSFTKGFVQGGGGGIGLNFCSK